MGFWDVSLDRMTYVYEEFLYKFSAWVLCFYAEGLELKG